MSAPKKRSAQNGARGRRQAGFKPDTLTNGEHRGDAVFGAIYGALRPLDEIAVKMESKWGNDRLETLVTPETASKFAMVRERLNAAIDAADVAGVQREAGIMYRGWIALDLEAARLGAEPSPSGVWNVTGDNGTQYRITLTDEDKFGLCAALNRDDAHRVLSIEELLRIYEHSRLAIVREAQKHFPGARITYAGEMRESTKQALGLNEANENDGLGGLFDPDRLIEDPIPF
jgi:hypothetical protein